MAALAHHEDVMEWLLEQQTELEIPQSTHQQSVINTLNDEVTRLKDRLKDMDIQLSGKHPYYCEVLSDADIVL